ncbi:hypothetical protein ANN_26196 [Periplaneta americana]|uniref:Uncharacterized protein n=1 Tax=Periplaneta americana TaxID=6978 RepID=A0ABQ8S591_PERAM|nr:hypothetical protein ANN_26196 [Periplaneta americana]
MAKSKPVKKYYFQKKWEYDYFVVEEDERIAYLLCPIQFISTRHFNIKRHFNKAHIKNNGIDKLSEKMAWHSFKTVCSKFLGNSKADNYIVLLETMVRAYDKMSRVNKETGCSSINGTSTNDGPVKRKLQGRRKTTVPISDYESDEIELDTDYDVSGVRFIFTDSESDMEKKTKSVKLMLKAHSYMTSLTCEMIFPNQKECMLEITSSLQVGYITPYCILCKNLCSSIEKEVYEKANVEAVPGNVGIQVKDKLGQVLDKNEEYMCSIANVLCGEKFSFGENESNLKSSDIFCFTDKSFVSVSKCQAITKEVPNSSQIFMIFEHQKKQQVRLNLLQLSLNFGEHPVHNRKLSHVKEAKVEQLNSTLEFEKFL